MKRFILVLAVLCVFLTLSTAALAAEEKTVYFSGQSWDIPRDKWDDYKAYFDKYEKPVLEKALAEGIIVEWGLAAEGLHGPDTYSHSVWFGAHSLADLEKVYEISRAVLGEEVSNETEEMLAQLVTKHRDTYIRSIRYRSKTSSLTQGYLLGSSVQVAPGSGRDYIQGWDHYQQPVLDKLLADGVILGYSLETQYYHTEKPGRWTTYYVIDDMAKDEQVAAAWDEAGKDTPEIVRTALGAQYRSRVEEGSHRDSFDRIIYFQAK